MRSFTAFRSSQHFMLTEVSVVSSQETAICPYSESDQYSSLHRLIYWRSVLILHSNLRLNLPSVLFPSGFPAKTICTPLLFPIHTTCLAHLILLDVIAQIVFCEKYGLWCQSLCAFLHFPVTSSLLGPNIFLNTLFSNTLSLGTSLSMSDQVSRTYKTTGTVLILCIFNLHILDNRDGMVAGIPRFDCAEKSLNECSFDLLRLFPKCYSLLPIFKLWVCSAPWPRDVNMYLVFSVSLVDYCSCWRLIKRVCFFFFLSSLSACTQ